MDSRQIFVDETVRQLDFLRASEGFDGPDVRHNPSPGTAISVSYQRSVMLIQVSLELDRASAQYVVLTGFVDGGDGNVQRREISRVDARTERHVREALERIGRDIQQTTIGDVGNARPPARRPKFGRRRSDKD